MSEIAKKKEPGMAQLTITLCIICAVCALLLGLTNMVTADKIEAITEQKTISAMQSVLPADNYEKVDYSGDDATVLAVNKAGDAGYVVEVGPTGFGGVIDMVVGVKDDGTISGISFISMSETSGLGQNAKKETFYGQFTGGSGPFSVTKDGGTINALTGATITSRAVCRGVNSALTAVQSLG